MTLMADFLKDRKVNTDPSDEYGYNNDSWLRPNTDRYWVRGKYDYALAGDFFAKIEVDLVSDQDYLKTFNGGYTGYDAADEYFEDAFGRDLEDENDTTRTSTISLSKAWSQFALNGQLQWNDDVIQRRWQEEKDNTIMQKLPAIELDATKNQLFSTQLYYTMENKYSYNHTEDGIRGHLVDIYPRAYLPYQLGNYARLEPSAGVRETFWHVDRFGEETHNDRNMSREI